MLRDIVVGSVLQLSKTSSFNTVVIGVIKWTGWDYLNPRPQPISQPDLDEQQRYLKVMEKDVQISPVPSFRYHSCFGRLKREMNVSLPCWLFQKLCLNAIE